MERQAAVYPTSLLLKIDRYALELDLVYDSRQTASAPHGGRKSRLSRGPAAEADTSENRLMGGEIPKIGTQQLHPDKNWGSARFLGRPQGLPLAFSYFIA